jgi:glucokinase
MSESANPDLVTLGIDFGGTSVKVAAVRGAEILSEVERIVTSENGSPEEMIAALNLSISRWRKQFPEIAAVGVGVPGAVDVDKGMTYNLTNVPGWCNFPLRDELQKACGLPVMIDNDANCMAFAEFSHGAGKGARNGVAVTLGTGVGGGVFIDGKLHRGSDFAAGEIGQMSIAYDGVEGPYGNSGALERYVGHRQISQIAAELFEAAGREFTEEDCAPHRLTESASNGDEIAHQVWHRVADYLGTALGAVIYLINPDTLVIGGGVSAAGDVLFEPLKEKLQQVLSVEFYERLRIEHALLGNDAGIIGSAALAREMVG